MTATATASRSQTGRQLAAYLQLLSGPAPAGRLLEIRYRPARAREPMSRLFVPARRPDLAARTIATLAARADVWCGVLLRTRHAGGRDAVAASHLAWAEIDHPDALERLHAFAHPASMIVRSGTPGHAHAYWQLTQPISLAELERANRRLAHHLGGDQAAVDAARILRPCGTQNHKHHPPTQVTLAAHRPQRRYELDELVGELADPPGPQPRAPAGAAQRVTVTALDARLLSIPAATYTQRLTGRQVGRDGKLRCPFHDDRTPSLQTYEDGSWYCYGCARGGSIYDFAAALWHTPTKGRAFVELRERLATELGC